MSEDIPMSVFQDDNARIHWAQIVKRVIQGAWEIILTHELVTTESSDPVEGLRDVMSRLWRRVYAIVNTRINATLDENKWLLEQGLMCATFLFGQEM